MPEIAELSNLECRCKVVLGETRRPLGDIMKITEGSILELDRLAGEPVDIEVNGKVLFKGEVVVINEAFGVRVTGLAAAPPPAP